MAVGGCAESPTATEQTVQARESAGAATDPATEGATTDLATERTVAARGGPDGGFPHWNQNFNTGTDGWFGEDTPGDIGWCGDVTWYGRGSGPVPPSRSRGYATVAQGGCNDFFSTTFPNLLGAPWAPGPEASNFSSFWPRSDFVMQLDIYLDPAWANSSIACEFPSEEPFFPPLQPCNYFAVHSGSVFTLAAALREIDGTSGPGGTFTYFAVPVMPGTGALSIFGHDITDAGWYTFKWNFRDRGGQVGVIFELSDRRGGTILSESIDQRLYGGATSSLDPQNWGSGYLWFVRISPHIELPIDEHRLRRGR